LRRSYRRCLWDGGTIEEGEEFCSTDCLEAFELWAIEVLAFDEERHIIQEGTGS
jgi:hypothetical protein